MGLFANGLSPFALRTFWLERRPSPAPLMARRRRAKHPHFARAAGGRAPDSWRLPLELTTDRIASRATAKAPVKSLVELSHRLVQPSTRVKRKGFLMRR